MIVPFVDLSRQHQKLRREIDEAIKRVIDSSWFVLGKEVEDFEAEFSRYLGVKYCYGVGSGTDALRLALLSLDVGAGDEVLIPANTFISAALETSFIGAKPVLVDIEDSTYNIDPEKMAKKINSRTKVVILTHLYGQPGRVKEVLSLARKHNLKVIEDACQAHGAEYKGKRVGNFGEVACFSFYPAKNLGALGDGGAVVCQSAKIAQKLRLLRNYGENKKYYYCLKGFNSRLDPLQAAVLRAKLKYLDDSNGKRIAAANLYRQKLTKVKEVVLPKELEESKPVYHLFVIRSKKRNQLVKYLGDNGIKTQIHYPVPIHWQKSFDDLGYKKGDFPVTEECSRQIISLPMFPELTKEEINYVCENISDFFEKKAK